MKEILINASIAVIIPALSAVIGLLWKIYTKVVVMSIEHQSNKELLGEHKVLHKEHKEDISDLKVRVNAMNMEKV